MEPVPGWNGIQEKYSSRIGICCMDARARNFGASPLSNASVSFSEDRMINDWTHLTSDPSRFNIRRGSADRERSENSTQSALACLANTFAIFFFSFTSLPRFSYSSLFLLFFFQRLYIAQL